jgi:hypothetical protein
MQYKQRELQPELFGLFMSYALPSDASAHHAARMQDQRQGDRISLPFF